MDNNIKNLCTLLTDILSFKKHNGNPQEIVVDSNNRITTPQSLTRFSANDVSQETALENARARLSDRLIQLKIDNITTKSATNIEERIYSEIESFYVEKGFMPEVIKNAIELSCDPSYGMDEYLFTTVLESSRPSHQDQLAPTKKYSLKPSAVTILKGILLRNKFELDSIYTLLEKIQELAIDDNLDTIQSIINMLETEYNIESDIILQHIIVTLFGDEKLLEIIAAKQQDAIREKQRRDTLRLNSVQIAKIEEQKKIEQNKQFVQSIYTQRLNLYRANGLELDKKHTLVIGSQFVDITGSYFDKRTTIFADLEYADLNGDIFKTIDTLHKNIKMHGKLNLINFTSIGGLSFNDIDKSICLIMKLYDLLQPDGILVIYDGALGINSEINLNSKFADKILVPAGFKLENIVGISSCLNMVPIKNHTMGELIFNQYKDNISDENNTLLHLIAKK